MNILFIGTTDILGGAAKVSWELKIAIEKAGHTATMFVADKHSIDTKVKVIPRQRWRKYLGYLLGTERLVSTDWIMKTEEYRAADVVHCHNLHGRFFNLETLEKMSHEKPVIWTLHDEWAITAHCAYTLENTKISHGLYVCPSINTPPRILWDNTVALAKWKTGVYGRSNLNLVTPSHWLQKRVARTPLGTHKLHHVPNGIDTSTFVRSDKKMARQKLGLPLDKNIVLFLANDAKNNIWKGWKFTENIVQRHLHDDNMLFLSVGNLSTHDPETNVWHHGEVKDPMTLALYYSAADVLLFTSIADNFPLVILEAMSCGLPIVTFDVGGVSEVVTADNGIVVEYQNIEALHQALMKILSLHESEREAIGSLSIQKVRTAYGKEHMISAYFDLYEKLIPHHG